jgi:hypothetical protein
MSTGKPFGLSGFAFKGEFEMDCGSSAAMTGKVFLFIG